MATLMDKLHCRDPGISFVTKNNVLTNHTLDNFLEDLDPDANSGFTF